MPQSIALSLKLEAWEAIYNSSLSFTPQTQYIFGQFYLTNRSHFYSLSFNLTLINMLFQTFIVSCLPCNNNLPFLFPPSNLFYYFSQASWMTYLRPKDVLPRLSFLSKVNQEFHSLTYKAFVIDPNPPTTPPYRLPLSFPLWTQKGPGPHSRRDRTRAGTRCF